MPKLLGVKDGSLSAKRELEDRNGFKINRKKFSTVYYVLADDTGDTEDDVIFLTAGLPQVGSLVNGAFAVSHQAKESQTVIHPVTAFLTVLWEVTVEFDSNFDPEEDGQEEDPTDITPTIRWSGETEEEVLESDAITAEAVVTAAGEQILVMAPIVLPILEIKRYEIYPFDPDVMLDFSNRTNSTPFWGAPVGSALMLPMEADEEKIEGIKYALVTYRIKFKIKPGVDEPWKARVLHQGTMHRDPDFVGPDPPAIRAVDKFGNPITVNLGSNGLKLGDDDPPEYLEFNRYQKADFNVLNLGPF